MMQAEKTPQKFKKNHTHLDHALVYLGLVVASLLVVLPFAIVLTTSFMTKEDAVAGGFSLFGKDGFTLQGYKTFFGYKDYYTGVPRFFSGLLSTMITSLIPTLASLFCAALAAFAFAKIRFRMSKTFFNIILFTMMIPGTILMVPHYLMYESFGWIDTYWAVIVPTVGAPLGLFILRNYMTTVPDSLLEAARIDGCNDLTIYGKIVMPLVRPAWLTVIVLMFQQVWGASNTTYVYSEELKTLPYALSQITSGGIVRQGAGQAASVMMLLVPAIVFIFNQSRILGTMATSGMKE